MISNWYNRYSLETTHVHLADPARSRGTSAHSSGPLGGTYPRRVQFARSGPIVPHFALQVIPSFTGSVHICLCI